MMKPQAQHWCDTCDKRIEFDREKDFILVDRHLEILGTPIFLKDQKTAICSNCKEETYDEILATEELQASIKEWEKQTGLIFSEQFPKKDKKK